MSVCLSVCLSVRVVVELTSSCCKVSWTCFILIINESLYDVCASRSSMSVVVAFTNWLMLRLHITNQNQIKSIDLLRRLNTKALGRQNTTHISLTSCVYNDQDTFTTSLSVALYDMSLKQTKSITQSLSSGAVWWMLTRWSQVWCVCSKKTERFSGQFLTIQMSVDLYNICPGHLTKTLTVLLPWYRSSLFKHAMTELQSD